MTVRSGNAAARACAPPASAKFVTEALSNALREPGPDGTAPNLRRVVAALVEKAAGGDLASIKEIFDRVEGRAAQAAAPEPDQPAKVIFSWKSDESN